MTITIAVNAQNDMYIGTDGNLAMATGITATLQACAQAAKTILGEMIFATNQGIPYYQTVWNGVPNLQQFEAALRTAILAVAGVTDIISLLVTQTGDTLSYTAVILTVYGEGVVNG